MKGCRAFTMVELLCVISIIMMVAGWWVVVYWPDDGALMSEALLLESSLRFTHYYALARGVDQTVIFDTDQQSYSYPTIHGSRHTHKLPPTVHFGFPPKALGPPAYPKTPINTAVTFGKQQGLTCAIFFAHGSMTAGTIYLKTDDDHALALTCGVAAGSTIKIYRHDHQSWKLLPHNQCCL